MGVIVSLVCVLHADGDGYGRVCPIFAVLHMAKLFLQENTTTEGWCD